MFRLLLLALVLFHAVFALPQEADKNEELSRDMELLQRALERHLFEDEAEPEEESKRFDDKRVFGQQGNGGMGPTLTLVKMNKPQTRQSSTLQFRGMTYVSGNAVDNNFNSDLINGGSCAHTKTETNPLWQMRLRESHCIAQVGIVNRRDGDYDRLAGAEVLVGGIVCGSPVTAESANIPGGMNIVICDPPIAGSDVAVRIPRDGATLQICEVLIWETPICNQQNAPSW